MTTTTYPPEQATLTVDQREHLLRVLAEDFNDLHHDIKDLVWDGFVAAAARLADWQPTVTGSVPVLFEDVVVALQEARRAADDPTSYATELYGDTVTISGFQRDQAEQDAQHLVDAALQALTRPHRGAPARGVA